MTDHAHELRRHARKIGHPAGDVPSVMLAAADEIERLQAKAEAAEKERDFAKTEIARLHDDIRELTDVRVLDEEDRDLLAWLQGASAKPVPSIPEGWKLVPTEVIDLYSFMCAAFVPVTPQHEEVAIQLDLAKRAMLAAAPEAKPCP